MFDFKTMFAGWRHEDKKKDMSFFCWISGNCTQKQWLNGNEKYCHVLIFQFHFFFKVK